MEQLAREISAVLNKEITTQYLWENRARVMTWLKETLEHGNSERKATEAARLYRRLS